MAGEERDETDEILASLEEPSAERPMSGEEEKPEAPEAPAAPSWNAKEWEFDFNGKKIAPDSREKALTWLSQGHNYSQKAAEFNRREAEYKAKLSDTEKRFSPYSQVDEYAAKNPDWWKHVQESWTNRDQQQGQVDPAFAAALRPLQEKLEAMNSFVTSAQQEKQLQEQTRADEALSTEIETTRKSHPNIDLNAVDETGRTLESRVIAHAQEIGTGSFRAAFRDYLHDKLVESAKANSQTAQAKAAEHTKKQGILGTSPIPKKASSDAPANHRGRSYDDITRSVLDEYGIQN